MSEIKKTDFTVHSSGKHIIYPRKNLHFHQVGVEDFSPAEPTIYAIEWDGVTYELLIRRQPENRQAVVWGNGDVDKKKHSLPIFDRHSWGKELTFNGIWYFDPTLYRGEASLCWCYGTNDRWYLKDIAYLIYLILRKWNVSLQQVLYFGSSAGGFTSMMLAVLLHGKALAINPQFDCMNFWPRLVGLFKKQVLRSGEEVLLERVNIVELIKKEHYCPSIHIVQNLLAENDMKKQVSVFLQQLPLCDEDTPIQIDFYKNIKGHSGIPSKEECLELIQKEIPLPDKEHILFTPQWLPEIEYRINNFNSKKLYIIITCDTEDKYGNIPYLYECNFEEKGNCGVQYIMEQLEKRGMRGVFFTNVYEHENFTGKYKDYLEKLIRNMTERGHEVGLHPHHEGFMADFYNKNIFLYDYDGIKKIISYGIDFIVKHTGKAPISIRGGGYRCNDEMFKVLSDKGIKVDSSCFYMHGGTSNRIHHYRSLNQVCIINNVLEFPVICVFDNQGREKKFDINQLNIEEMKNIVEAMKQRKDFSAAQFMFHSFSFLDQKGREGDIPAFTCGTHNGYGIHPGLMKRFEQFLDHLQQDPDIEVVTFEQYLEKQLPLPSMWGDGLFHTGTEVSKKAVEDFKGRRSNTQAVLSSSFDAERTSLYLQCALPMPQMYFSDNAIPRIADGLIHNQLIVYNRIEAMPYNLDNFDWNTEFSNIPRTFQLYLQALNPVQILVRAYEKTRNVEFLRFAWRMITNWYNYATSEQANSNPFAWGDHATALRAENLLYFAEQCEYSGFWADNFYQKLHTILHIHGEKLYDDTRYTKNHNHGIMQDQALLHLGYVLQKQEWIDHALDRLGTQKTNAFNEEGIPTENSPGYAFLVPSLFKKIGDFLAANNSKKGKELIACSEQAKRFQGWVIKPNGILAQKGDTSNSPGLRYGNISKMARQDEATSVWWPRAGYYFYRSNKDTKALHDTWKMFIAGFCNTTHKHADDCSFMLYSKGYEIFTDCGIYGYKKDAFRDYFTSSLAHNTIIVDGQSYPCTKKNFSKTGMCGGIITKEYDHIRAFNDIYEGVHIERDFCSCDDVTIIYDSMESSTTHLYSQLFHLAEDIEVIRADFREVLLKIADSGFVARLRQYGSDGTLHVLKGDISKPSFGLISRGEGHMDVISTLKFDVSASSGTFITLITIEDEVGTVRLSHSNIHGTDIRWLENKKSFQVKENIIIPCRDALPPLQPDKLTEKDILAFRIEKEDTSGLAYEFVAERPLADAQYAWYIYKQGQSTAKVKISYSSDTVHTHRFEARGTYRVKLFVKTNEWIKTAVSDWFTVG